MTWLDDMSTDLRKMDKQMERQSKGLRRLEAYCKGGQGPPQAVAPLKEIIL
jgi:HEAT repeat protein